MDCSFVRENLFAILEGTIPDEKLAKVQTHAESCRGCRELLSLLRTIDDNIRAIKNEEPDPFIETRTIARLESMFRKNSGKTAPNTRLVLRPVLIGFFLGLAILAGILSGRFGYSRHAESVSAGEEEILKSELAIDALADEETSMIIR
jgi:predicted anti-sigma-YlaC factor YlaD